MERQLDAWLKTFRNETMIAPVDWESLPAPVRNQLDDFARDEAVRRADHFAKEGYLDLKRQDTIRQFVESMARVWRLTGDAVRPLVEDALDELPPLPGREFEKLATKLFRRRASAPWSELRTLVDLDKEHPVVQAVFGSLAFDEDAVIDRSQLVAALGHVYNDWSLAHPREAVEEAIETARASADKADLGALAELAALRGGETTAKALELEREVGVETADRDELIRILKRYALIVRRGGSVELDRPISSGRLAATTGAAASENGPEEHEDEQPAVQSPQAAADVTSGDRFAAPSEEDSEVAREMFGAAEVDVEPATVPEESASEPTSADNAEPEDNEPAEDTEAAPAEREGDMPEKEEQDENPADASEAVPGEDQEQDDEEPQPQLQAAAPSEEGTNAEVQAPEDQAVPVQKDSAGSAAKDKKRLRDAFSPSHGNDFEDRFAMLREGDLRQRVIQEMYDGDETMLDVFLAKLSGAPDWNRAKQFIANEFFRCDIELHSELGEEFFHLLKRSLQG